MSCDRHRSTFTEVALGAAATPALEAHLAECAGCRAALEERRRLLGRIDSEIAASLAGATPSADFLPRVRRRVAERADAPPGPLGRFLPAAAVVAVLVAGILLTGRRPDEPLPTPRRTAAGVGAALLPPAPSVVARPAPRPAPAVAVPVAHTQPARSTEPEVLVPPGEAAAVRRLARALRHQGVDAASFLANGPEPVPPRDIRVDPVALLAVRLFPSEPRGTRVEPIEVKPLTLEPITRSDS